MRDHGGNLDWAVAQFGGQAEDWVDLSTGINPFSYPVRNASDKAWTDLPTRTSIARLCEAAAVAYRTEAHIVACAGAQAAIQLVPHLLPVGQAAVLGPTYNEHAAALRASGWRVREAATLDELSGTDLAIVVNPNNPTGRVFTPNELIDVAGTTGLLVIDESFVDPDPATSVAPHLHPSTTNMLVQRSFGKFFGLAGVRLGFVLTGADLADRMRELAGPWAVSGVAIEVGISALTDLEWQADMRRQLGKCAELLDGLAAQAGWDLNGGTALFRTYATPNAEVAQKDLAQRRIWTRRFPYSDRWLRLGLPGDQEAWDRVEEALLRLGE